MADKKKEVGEDDTTTVLPAVKPSDKKAEAPKAAPPKRLLCRACAGLDDAAFDAQAKQYVSVRCDKCETLYSPGHMVAGA